VTAVNERVEAQLYRRCGRCRKAFPLETGADARTASDWWACEPCRAKPLPDLRS
jgi:hypothetical protein